MLSTVSEYKRYFHKSACIECISCCQKKENEYTVIFYFWNVADDDDDSESKKLIVVNNEYYYIIVIYGLMLPVNIFRQKTNVARSMPSKSEERKY